MQMCLNELLVFETRISILVYQELKQNWKQNFSVDT